jgi:hypothetical protein
MANKTHWNKRTDTKEKRKGMQRHFRGKMTLPNGSPRAHTHGGHSQADRGFECQGTKVSYPTKRAHRHGVYRAATTGEILHA